MFSKLVSDSGFALYIKTAACHKALHWKFTGTKYMLFRNQPEQKHETTRKCKIMLESIEFVKRGRIYDSPIRKIGIGAVQNQALENVKNSWMAGIFLALLGHYLN